uniref:6-pyruvoyl tetrahydropterin synthase family protein n=1 Tax=Fervidicoccus fontis TaxID=683846 RepID=A0A7J3ZLI1_9CREN
MRFVVGVEGLSFDSANYTLGESEKCLNLHGHTFRVSVEVLGEIRGESGMVLDFTTLKRIVREVVEEFDHKVILPKGHVSSTIIQGPFKTEIKELKYPHATAEYIALEMAERIYERLKMPLRLKLYEGTSNYVIIELGEW